MDKACTRHCGQEPGTIPDAGFRVVLKMHANEVYQSLKMGRDDEAFCWRAATSEIIGSTGLIDAQSHFS